MYCGTIACRMYKQKHAEHKQSHKINMILVYKLWKCNTDKFHGKLQSQIYSWSVHLANFIVGKGYIVT